MGVTSPNATLAVTTVAEGRFDLTKDIKDKTGINLFASYVPGSESYLEFRFRNVDTETGSSVYLCKEENGFMVPAVQRMKTVSPLAIPVPTVEGCDSLIIEVTFVDDTSNMGSLVVEAQYAEQYQ